MPARQTIRQSVRDEVWRRATASRAGPGCAATGMFTGKRGKLVLRSQYTWIEAGGPYNVATGTWKVVSGTGQYAHVAGGGRNARNLVAPNPEN